MIKENLKNIILPCLTLVTGMLSVSISNIFGNHYGFVAIIVIVLSALYTYNLFDKGEEIGKNLANLVLMGTVLFFQLLFFVVNDIINIPVYTKNSLGFFGVCVLVSQIISVVGLLYLIVNFVLQNKETYIEVVGHDDLKDTEELAEVDSQLATEEEKKEVRFISEKNNQQNVPFMEENEK